MTLVDEIKKEGVSEGIREGERKREREIALKMLSKNTDMDYIIDVTGLTEDEIKKL